MDIVCKKDRILKPEAVNPDARQIRGGQESLSQPVQKKMKVVPLELIHVSENLSSEATEHREQKNERKLGKSAINSEKIRLKHVQKENEHLNGLKIWGENAKNGQDSYYKNSSKFLRGEVSEGGKGQKLNQTSQNLAKNTKPLHYGDRPMTRN